MGVAVSGSHPIAVYLAFCGRGMAVSGGWEWAEPRHAEVTWAEGEAGHVTGSDRRWRIGGIRSGRRTIRSR